MVYYKGNHPFYGLDFQVSMIIYPDYILFGSGTCQTLFQDICGTHDLSHVRKCATKSYWSAYISEYVSTEDVLTEYVRLYVKHIRPRVCHDKCIHIFRMYVFQCVRTIFKVHVNKNIIVNLNTVWWFGTMEFYDFPFSWEFHSPNMSQLTESKVQQGVYPGVSG